MPTATRIATAEFGPGAWAQRLPGVGWMVKRPRGALEVVDEELATVARFASEGMQHWVTSDLEHAVVSEKERVVMIDRDGRVVWQTPHPAWGKGNSNSGCCWVNGAFVWATVPSASGPDEWWVLDATDGRVLGVAPLECHAAGSFAYPHPDGVHVGLSVGLGQDGCEVYWGGWDAGPRVSRLDACDRVLCAVRPDGSAYLATPHSAGELTVHAFPSGAVIARVKDADVDDEGCSMQTAGYVTNDVILVCLEQSERHRLLAADTLEVIGEVEHEEEATSGGMFPSGRGTWLTSDYESGRHELWRLG